MIRTVIITALLIAASPSLAAANNSTVGSAAGCKTYQEATGLLKDFHDEELVGRGLMSRGSVRVVLEIWASHSGSWTAIRVLPNGCTQPVQSGDGWHVPLDEPGDDDA
jgi:hypothetical protein